jgi:hypothetical protein
MAAGGVHEKTGISKGAIGLREDQRDYIVEDAGGGQARDAGEICIRT